MYKPVSPFFSPSRRNYRCRYRAYPQAGRSDLRLVRRRLCHLNRQCRTLPFWSLPACLPSSSSSDACRFSCSQNGLSRRPRYRPLGVSYRQAPVTIGFAVSARTRAKRIAAVSSSRFQDCRVYSRFLPLAADQSLAWPGLALAGSSLSKRCIISAALDCRAETCSLLKGLDW